MTNMFSHRFGNETEKILNVGGKKHLLHHRESEWRKKEKSPVAAPDAQCSRHHLDAHTDSVHASQRPGRSLKDHRKSRSQGKEPVPVSGKV